MRDRARIGWVAVAGAGTVAVLLMLVTACGTAGPVSVPPPTADSASSTPAPSTVPPVTTPPSTVPPTTVPKSPTVASLRPGTRGGEVLALQQRLVDLGYWLGTPDGDYGTVTEHAVTAFQKVNGLSRDGVAGPLTLAALAHAGPVRPRSTKGRVVEVDLARQVLVLAVDGRTRWVFDTSTGAVRGSTPTGHFTVLRQVDGYDRGPLGVLYRPKYFTGGVAVHGYPDVPTYPASHGCVRVLNAAMDWLWADGAMPIGQPVWVY